MNAALRSTAALALCAALSACTGTRPLRADFYHAPPPAASPALKVALYVPPKVKEAVAYLQTEKAPGFGGRMGAVVPAGEAYALAVSSALASLFEVRPVSAQAAAAGSDLLVTVDSRFPSVVGWTFTDPKTWEMLGTYWRPALTDGTRFSVVINTDLLFMLYCYGILPGAITNPFAVKNAGKAGSETLASVVSTALDGVLEEVRADKRLFGYPAADARSRAEAAAGDIAEAGGDPEGALAHYVAAIKDAWPGGALAKGLRPKCMKAVGQLAVPPRVPEEAARSAAHAQAYFKSAQSEADYDKAIAKMEEALALAPWWPDAYYNLGFMQAGAKRYDAAIENLKLYLLGAPRAGDAKAVQNKIYELEVAGQVKR